MNHALALSVGLLVIALVFVPQEMIKRKKETSNEE